MINIDGTDYIPADQAVLAPSAAQIVVLQRGWVAVGQVAESEDAPDEFVISDAHILRRWGTSKGLGELVNGPLENTVLDPAGTVRTNKLGVVMRVDVSEAAWSPAALAARAAAQVA